MRGVLTSRQLIALAALLVTAASAGAQMVAVAPELWDRPRSGAAIMEQSAVRQAVHAYLAQPGTRLVIHHAAGQEPGLYAEELRSWLIALAIDSERIALRGDLARGDPLKIEVVQ